MRKVLIIALLASIIGCSYYSTKEGLYIKENVPESYSSPDRFRNHNNAGGLDK